MQLPPPTYNLDSALHELGMLATRTNSRQEYLQELTRPKQLLNMLTTTINTRYVSNVSMGFCVRPTTAAPHVRYKPYKLLPKREERHRTRSENNDNDNTSLIKAMIEEKIHQSIEDLNQLKKAKSLESIAMENNKPLNFNELEVVSDCIQNLKVDEWQLCFVFIFARARAFKL